MAYEEHETVGSEVQHPQVFLNSLVKLEKSEAVSEPILVYILVEPNSLKTSTLTDV